MKLIYAWDDPDVVQLPAFLQEFDRIKIGKEVFTARGPEAIYAAMPLAPVFLDLKYHDIPHTVAGAVRRACDHGVSMVNVHVSGGMEMMEAAAKAAEAYDTLVIGVTVLTSMKADDFVNIGLEPIYSEFTDEDVIRALVEGMALRAKAAGLDGVVCSAREAQIVRQQCGENFTIVCPAIRPEWSVPADQKRPTTPKQALDAGADEIVLGRAISAPPREVGSPENALKLIREEIGQ